MGDDDRPSKPPSGVFGRYCCPRGHSCEDRTMLNINPGIECHACHGYYTCDTCGWSGTDLDGIRWITNDEAANRHLQPRNPRDLGVYGLCPSCQSALFHTNRRSWWPDEAALLRDNGARISPGAPR